MEADCNCKRKNIGLLFVVMNVLTLCPAVAVERDKEQTPGEDADSLIRHLLNSKEEKVRTLAAKLLNATEINAPSESERKEFGLKAENPIWDQDPDQTRQTEPINSKVKIESDSKEEKDERHQSEFTNHQLPVAEGVQDNEEKHRLVEGTEDVIDQEDRMQSVHDHVKIETDTFSNSEESENEEEKEELPNITNEIVTKKDGNKVTNETQFNKNTHNAAENDQTRVLIKTDDKGKLDMNNTVSTGRDNALDSAYQKSKENSIYEQFRQESTKLQSNKSVSSSQGQSLADNGNKQEHVKINLNSTEHGGEKPDSFKTDRILSTDSEEQNTQPKHAENSDIHSLNDADRKNINQNKSAHGSLSDFASTTKRTKNSEMPSNSQSIVLNSITTVISTKTIASPLSKLTFPKQEQTVPNSKATAQQTTTLSIFRKSSGPEKEINSIQQKNSCSTNRDNYYGTTALMSAAVGGAFVGGFLVFLLFYCKSKFSRYYKGNYQRVPMEYDFELNPRLKSHNR